jgi:glycerol-3-phosphate dehydrogenase
MSKFQTDVLVIGGGATGTGVLRDLALRGFKAILVEKGDLTHGTTGRYHGLLHSGGRYAVKDPQAAAECIEENRILRRIMPQCIEDTGGFFVVTPWDDPGYAPRFVEGCKTAGIPLEELTTSEMLRREPLLDPRILRCFHVPDGSADSFLGAHLNVESARAAAAQVLTYHKVERLLLAEGDPPRVVGAVCQDLASGEQVTITADLVVNAAGAWAGLIAGTAGIELKILAGKGTMLAMNQRIVHTVINRCRMPADGDILVPAHTVSVIGTTDVKVPDPDHFAIEPWEVNLCLEEGDKLVPGFKEMRMLRAWAGVRPLYQETATPAEGSDNRSVTRAFVLLDHAARDGVEGIISITSGKWTTYRKMAEVTVDLACKKLDVERPCRTHLEQLPDPHQSGTYHALPGRLAKVEEHQAYGELVCECELVTRQEVEEAIQHGGAKTIDDVRRDVRLGMGPCQGGFCTFRAAGILHEQRADLEDKIDVQATNDALRDFLQERWKGLLPILWGQQLRQERLDELIYLDLLNADHLPGQGPSPLASTNYSSPDTTNPRNRLPPVLQEHRLPRAETPSGRPELDLIVIGAGYAGLVGAWQASRGGLRVRLITKGWGSDHWGSGAIGVYGYTPSGALVTSPEQTLQELTFSSPKHPYAIAGLEDVNGSLEALKALCLQAGYPLEGSLERNWLLPSALGAPRPICLAPRTMIAGDLYDKSPVLVVGFRHYQDFYPQLIADNLAHQGISARAVSLDLKSIDERHFTNSRSLAQLFDSADFCQEVVQALQKHTEGIERIGFPAVLGLKYTDRCQADLEAGLDRRVFEIPTLPPSIPGMRLHRILVSAIERNGGSVFEGMQVIGAHADSGKVVSVSSEAGVRDRLHPARHFLLASGGLMGGGLKTAYDGSVVETVFNLPIGAPSQRTEWLAREFFAPGGHAIYKAGVEVNQDFQPIDSDGQVMYDNVIVAGESLAHCDCIRERSLEGVAIASAYAASSRLGKTV